MLISSGVLVSDCHKAVIYLEGKNHYCSRCMQPCGSAGTIEEVWANKEDQREPIQEQEKR